MLRDILVHVDGGQAGRHRVQLAGELSERLGARLHGLHITPAAEVPPVYKPSVVEKATTELTSKLMLEAGAAASCFKELASQRLANASWFETAGDVVLGICEKARYADLVILGQRERQGSPERHPLPISHAVVMRCGRPVLVVPPAVPMLLLEKVAVAWDGSREAVRAVHDALPLLLYSRAVHIITVANPDATNDIDANCLATHLINHGIRVETPVLNVRGIKELAVLQNQIEREHYNLLVMGGYSHPMWLEFIFGGTTRSLLSSASIPILVSH